MKLEDFAEIQRTTERINKIMKDALVPTFEAIGKSALSTLDWSAVQSVAAEQLASTMAPFKDLQLPAPLKDFHRQVDPGLFKVHEQPVRLMEPVIVELPDPPSWWSQHWIGLTGLVIALASLAVAIAT